MTDEDLYPTTLLNVVLGGNMSSRLFQEIRENRGLAYSIYSFLSSYLEIGSLGVYVAVDPATSAGSSAASAAPTAWASPCGSPSRNWVRRRSCRSRRAAPA